MKIFLASPHTLTRFRGGEGNGFYMAGGVSGNLKPFWNETAKKLMEGNDIKKASEDSMKIFLAGTASRPYVCQERVTEYKPYILESFFYADETTEKLIPYFGDFLLDSGAFTFMQQAGNNVDWDAYAYKYADFIKRNNIEKYIELDLDYIIGIEGARRLRSILEDKTGRKSIPVWHPIRGKESFLEMCEEYDYVALGGIVGKKWQGTEQYMPWFISEAHKRNAKIHGLGFTKLTKLQDYHFDSVDSTAWTTGNRFGYVYFFNGKTMIKKEAPKGCKLADSRAVALHNFKEWVKYQKWADVHF